MIQQPPKAALNAALHACVLLLCVHVELGTSTAARLAAALAAAVVTAAKRCPRRRPLLVLLRRRAAAGGGAGGHAGRWRPAVHERVVTRRHSR